MIIGNEIKSIDKTDVNTNNDNIPNAKTVIAETYANLFLIYSSYPSVPIRGINVVKATQKRAK